MYTMYNCAVGRLQWVSTNPLLAGEGEREQDPEVGEKGQLAFEWSPSQLQQTCQDLHLPKGH